jgi:hypothetical protein
VTGTLTAQRKHGGARLLAVALAIFAALMLSGCIGNDTYDNNPKPPAVLNLTIVIGEDDIAVSPNPFGAGPTRFLMTNQTGTNQEVTISTERLERKVNVGKGQTVNFKITLLPGELSIDTSNSAAGTFTTEVGPKRESAQQDLDQP